MTVPSGSTDAIFMLLLPTEIVSPWIAITIARLQDPFCGVHLPLMPGLGAGAAAGAGLAAGAAALAHAGGW